MSTGALPPAGDWIRGISIKQPRAACILHGDKRIENRPRPWPWRGWMLLHTSQQTDRAALRLPPVARTIRGSELPTGAVIGVARLTGCHQDPDSAPPCGPWSEPGRWHLELDDVQSSPADPRPRTPRALEAHRGPGRPSPPAAPRPTPVTCRSRPGPTARAPAAPAPLPDRHHGALADRPKGGTDQEHG